MSIEHLSAYRYYKNSDRSKVGLGEKRIPTTLFDKHFVGLASTYPHDDVLVTDSAASATALSSGIKTYNNAIAVDHDQNELTTVLQKAKQLGKLTATVSTSQVTHATPASFWAHNASRKNQNDIANQAFDRRINGAFTTDLLLGGGTKYFFREDRNLIDEFQQQGWQYTDNLHEIHKLESLPAIGLFAPKGLPFAIDNKGLPNRLEHMTKKALQLLDKNNPNGFFVMIEGSQIDWCSHGNDISCVMKEMLDFELAFQAAIDFAKKDGNTLIVLTADHGTGGLAVGKRKEYIWLPDVVHQVNISAEHFINEVKAGADIAELWQKNVEFALTSEQLENFKTLHQQKDYKAFSTSFTNIVNELSFTGWTTKGHTGGDVAVISYGVGSEMFRGHQDNTDLAKKLFDLLK